MTYGIKYIPDGFDRPILLENSRTLSYLGTVKATTGRDTSGTVNYQISSPTANATTLIVPRKLIDLKTSITSQEESISYVTGVRLSGSVLSVDYIKSIPRSDPSRIMSAGEYDVFCIAGANSASGYGLRIRNSTDFTQINDSFRLGFVTWKGLINVNGSWGIPQDIVAKGSYIVFANWNNTDNPLFLDRENNQIQCFTAFGNSNGSIMGGVVSNVRIVIVSSGFFPEEPASGYGILIRNSSGQVTFSSKYAPVKWSGAVYNFSFHKEYSSDGREILNWSSIVGNISGSPLIPLATLGWQVGDYSSADYRPIMYSGMKMNSSGQVSSSRGKPANGRIRYKDNYGQVACSLPALDTNDYF